MAPRMNGSVELLSAVPSDVRERILSGMRWTVWLSILAIPFTYGTNILLARTSPEAIGTYGLLGIYVSLATCFFYLGGDTVIIKFIPEIEPERRLSFLASYFLVVCLTLVPWLVSAAFWPRGLRYLLGRELAPSFAMLLLILSPIYILYSMSAAALKGTLEFVWAQAILRTLTIGTFFSCAVLYFGHRGLLATHYTELIWSIYLGLAALAGALGLLRLLRLEAWRLHGKQLAFFLPRGFWRYTMAIQQMGVVSFFINRLDYLLILNFGDLAYLGRYVALLTMAVIILVVNNFFLETLLPSLTNLIASRNFTAASEVFSMHMRILFLVNTATTCGLVLLAKPISSVLGPKYSNLSSLLSLLALLIGLASPGSVGGPVLSSVGKQQRNVWIGLGQIGLHVGLFLVLWPRFQLLGAVLAYGTALVISNLVLLFVSRLSAPFPFSVTRDYAMFSIVAIAAKLVQTKVTGLGLVSGLTVWAASMALFLMLGKYRLGECREFLRTFVPRPLGQLQMKPRED